MRNGNFPACKALYNVKMFLPYLWGMETVSYPAPSPVRNVSSYRTYEEWKLYTLLCNLRQLCVLTVPMRNGNFRTISRVSFIFSVLTVPMRNGNDQNVEDPMAQLLVLTVPMRNGNSPRMSDICTSVFVLTVPMRNGNSGYSLKSKRLTKVLTVPMRNGNT